MSRERIDGNFRSKTSTTAAERVIVAVRAEKLISKAALAWALTHVVHPGDCITLLAVFSLPKSGRRFWSFPLFSGDRGSRQKMLPDRIGQISESCSQMVLQFHDQIEVRVRIKVVSATPSGAVAAEAKSSAANWVILDKKLKQERKHCMEELRCNIVVMKGSQPRVLRLNLACLNELQTPFFSAASSPDMDTGNMLGHSIKHSTPVSSPEHPSVSHTRTLEEISLSSSDTVTSIFLVYEENPLFEGRNKGTYTPIHKIRNLDYPVSGSNGERLITLLNAPASTIKTNPQSMFWVPQNHIANEKGPITRNYKDAHEIKSYTTLLDKFVQFDHDMRNGGLGQNQYCQRDFIYNSSIRDAISLGRSSSTPPPLCSLCQHKAPVLGKPSRRFSYEELEEATNGFSDMNFVQEGGFGMVHRGVLRDGQMVAVKQLKFSGSQGDADFSREVRVLSCAQHRNVVLLIGFCIESKMRVLVYEYVCNSSLEFHLHGNKTSPLDWHSRLKIATGVARGLRYLHEDCRVGCIVHKDMRPSNILLTHDFEPLVSDSGLAQLYSTEGCAMGTSGYLAPEYLNGGKITEKVDIYAFGVVLLELLTGQKPRTFQRYDGQHLPREEWFHPLATLEASHIVAIKNHLPDPYFTFDQLHNFPHDVQAMVHAASLCLQRDPEFRPPMSKILRILEGGHIRMPISLDMNSIGSRSGHMCGLGSQQESRKNHSRQLSH